MRGLGEQRLELRKVRGDAQNGPPGARLAQALRIALRDEAGSPVAGVAVRFTASPGAQVAPASAVTDANGEAEARLRLPAAEGVSLVTAEALKQVVTFSALATAAEFKNFPNFMQAGEARLGRGTATIAEKGALLAAAASILRHHQNLGELPAANGLAETGLLNHYLTNFCVLDAQGIEVCDGFISAPGSGDQIVNLWRLAGFVSGNLEVVPEATDASSLRDLVALGSPVLVALALTAGDAAVGAHFVVATGVRPDGTVRIHDPNPALGRGTLEEYLAGFSAGSQRWKGVVTSAMRLVPRAASLTGFLVTAGNLPGQAGVPFELTSPAGVCGKTVEWPGIAATAQPPAAPPQPFRARYCEGVQAAHQLDAGAEDVYQLAVTDLGSMGSRFDLAGRGASAFGLTRPAGRLAVVQQEVTFETASVVNAASFTGAIAPGGIMTIFGSGLAPARTGGRPGGRSEVHIGGVPATVLAASPFQINAHVPLELAPGVHLLRVRSPYGVREQPVTLEPTAPAIFVLEGGQGAVVNQDGSLNSPATPARRGQMVTVYCTGLGAVTRTNSLLSTSTPVSVVLDGTELPVSFSGLTPGFVGLYQVNVLIPDGAAPRLEGSVALRQAGRLSNQVALSIR